MQPRIAFLSTAHIHTQAFLESFRKAEDGRVIACIWDDAPDRGLRYATEFGTRFESDLESLLSDQTIDGLIICAENTRHLPLLEKALPTGKPVFCEKPLVTSVGELRKVRTLAQQYPSTLFCGYFMPFEAAMQGARAAVQSGSLGKILRMRFRCAHHAAFGRWFDNPDLAWFTDATLSGGGAFMDLGTHAIHLARSMFGPVTEVWATINNQSGEYPNVDDNGIAQLRFASGVLGTIEASWTQTGGIGGLEVIGSKKSIWNNGTGYVIGAPQDPAQELAPGAAEPTRVDRLIAAIRGEITPEALKQDLDATCDSVAIIEACYRSAGSGNWVKVETAN